MRSRFLYAGLWLADRERLNEFMGYAWRAMLHVIANSDRFRTVDEYLKRVDELKFRGGSVRGD